MDNLNGFQRDLLYAIAGMDEPHGLAIKEELDDYYETELNHGRLYPNLDALAERGLIEKGMKDSRTNVYTITSEGEAVLRNRKEWKRNLSLSDGLLARPPVTTTENYG